MSIILRSLGDLYNESVEIIKEGEHHPFFVFVFFIFFQIIFWGILLLLLSSIIVWFFWWGVVFLGLALLFEIGTAIGKNLKNKNE